MNSGAIGSRNGIDLWSVRLSAVQPALGDPAPPLSDDERARAARMPALAAARFMAARRALREILAGYAGVRPEKLVFSYGRSGKPQLDARPAARTIAHLTGP